jgi:hypothetical protein
LVKGVNPLSKLGLKLGLASLLFLGQFSIVSHSFAKEAVKTQQINYDPEMDYTKNVWLSTYQKKPIKKYLLNIYRDYSLLIEAYAWAGALTPEQRKTRYKMLYNYYQTFTRKNYQWCSEHEPDEWEEE